MDSDQILAVYEDASRLTRQMLLATRSGDWDRLIAHEKDCAARFARLIANDTEQSPDADYQRRKAALIRVILDDDAQIRVLIAPWLEKLSALIGSTRQQSRLHQTYGAAP